MVTHLKYRYIDLHLLDCIRTTLRLIQMNVTDYKILFVHACAPKVWKFIPASCSFPSTQLTLTLLPHLPDYHSLGSGGNPSPFLPILVRPWRNRSGKKQKFKELSHSCFLGISWVSFQGSSLLYFLLNWCLHPAWIHRERESQQRNQFTP